MKALIVVLLISALYLLAHARHGICWDGTPNSTDPNSVRQVNTTLEEDETAMCTISYQWVENEGCVVSLYTDSQTVIDDSLVPICFYNPMRLDCECYESNCNIDLRVFYDELKRWKNELKGSEQPEGYDKLLNCVIEKSAALQPTTLTMEITTELSPSTTTTTEPKTTFQDILTAPTNTTESSSPSSFQPSEDEKSSSFLGLFIGSAVFNVLTVVTILVLVIVIIKMKKGGGAKQGSAKTEQKVPPTATVVQIEKPVEIKKSSEVLPSTDNKADQAEAAADSTTLNTATDGLDTTESSTISDSSTGQYGAGQVQITVRGFQKE